MLPATSRAASYVKSEPSKSYWMAVLSAVMIAQTWGVEK